MSVWAIQLATCDLGTSFGWALTGAVLSKREVYVWDDYRTKVPYQVLIRRLIRSINNLVIYLEFKVINMNKINIL